MKNVRYGGDISRTHLDPTVDECFVLIIFIKFTYAGDIPRTHVYEYIVLILGLI